MPAVVTQFWSDPVLQTGGTRVWTWALGDRDFYWGFSVRPYQANMTASILSTVSRSDNDLNQVTVLTVTAADTSPAPSSIPGQLRFTAIKVQNV
jgi:hypothetical protein